MKYQFRTLSIWPGPATPANKRKRGTFRAAWGDTLADLDRELYHLGATDLIIQAAVPEKDIRLDGMLRSDARLSAPGVILSFNSRHGPLSYPCDRYSDWQANVRAIALALEALRAVDRYGVTRRAEQYKGWAALPAPEQPLKREWAVSVIAKWAKTTAADVQRDTRAAIREAQKNTHPDRGGNAEDFQQVMDAASILGGQP